MISVQPVDWRKRAISNISETAAVIHMCDISVERVLHGLRRCEFIVREKA